MKNILKQKKIMEKSEENSTSVEILNQEFFDTIKQSKKINIKTQKIRELSKYFSSQNNIQSQSIKSKLPDLYNLLLINLNENNNNYVLAQMELIQVLGKILKEEENFKNFIVQSLPKLFDKFYLGNPKINEILVAMFSQFIEYKILTIKDYYQYIENIPLEDEDNYRMNILTFLYENIQKDETVLLNNIPKSINELIKKLINDNESDISETASKILNILINRDIESNKKKENNNLEKKEEKNNDNKEDKGGTDKVSNFVSNIVSAIKQNVEETNKNNKDNNIKINSNDNNSDNKDNNEKYEEDIKQNNNIKNNDNNSEKKEENKNNENIDENKNDKEGKNSKEKKEEKIKENEEKKIEFNETQLNEINLAKKEEVNEEKKDKEIIKEEKKAESIINEDKKESINKEPKIDNIINEEKKEINLDLNKDNNTDKKQFIPLNNTEEKEKVPEFKLEEPPTKIKEETNVEEHDNKPEEDIENEIINENKQNNIEIKTNEEANTNKTDENKNEVKIQEEIKNKNENIKTDEKAEIINSNENAKNNELKEEQKHAIIENKKDEKKEEQNEEKKKEEIIEKKPENNNKKENIDDIKIEEEKNKEKPKEENVIENKEQHKEDIKIEENKINETPKEQNKNVENKIENNNNDKKEEINNNDSKDINIKKEEEKKEENKTVPGKKKPGTGIKSKISKFRKNMGKNKKKDGGFEFELVVEKKKDQTQESNQEIKEEIDKEKEKINNDNRNDTKEIKKEEAIKEKEETVREKKEEEKPKEQKEDKKLEINENPIEEKKVINDEKINDEPKEEKPKEENIIKDIPKKELKVIHEEKLEEEIKQPQSKASENKKEELKSQPEDKHLTPEIEQKTVTEHQEPPQEKKEGKSLGINQESLNEFEKKLQLALEQEEKDKNNMESLVDNSNPAPVKQKKEDPKFDEIKSKLGKEIVDNLFSPKWEAKKKGFELINEFINNNKKESYNINDLIEYMKLKLKNYKETNFNINREAINIYINMIQKKIISKDNLVSIIIAYHEKLSDIKLKENIISLINNSFDILEPNNILKQIITKLSKKNNAKLLIEYATFFGKIVEEYDVKDLPNKDIIDYCKILANNSSPQVRSSAISLLCILYKYLGKDVKTLTRDIKESTLKLIDAELDKVKIIDPKESAPKKKAASVAENGPKSGSGGSKDLIPPQDISKKITPQIIKQLSGKWAEKKEACETMEKILVAANMRILPNGLNTLMTNIKKKLTDSNKNFVKMLVALLSKFIEAMKSGFKQWAKPIAQALIPNLADKNQLMRNECQNCFDKWVEFAGFDSLVIHFPKFLVTDNVEIRIEIMNFFMKYKDKFNKSTGEAVYKDMMNPLLICLQDRSSNVRNLSEEIIKISLVYNPINNYYKKIEDFKPAIAKTLKQILDKIKKELNTEAPPDNNTTTETENSQQSHQEPNNNSNQNNINININVNNSKTNEKAQKISGFKSSNKKLVIQTDTPLKTEASQDDSDRNESINEDTISNFNTISNVSNISSSTSKASKKSDKDSGKSKKIPAINVKRAKPKRKLSEDDLVNPLGTAMNKQMPASSVAHLASNSTILRKKELKSFQKNPSQVIKPNSGVFIINAKVIPNKLKRYEKDKKTKFNLETVNKDYFIKLKEQCKGLFNEPFAKKIFSDDFRKQVEAYKDMKSQIDKKINIPIYFDNLDLILKIIGIKIINNLNPTLMKNFFEFLDSLYQVLFENKYKLNDTESNIIINILIDKLSLNNNTLREHLISLLNKYIEFMDTNKIMITVLNVALNKNNKIKTDVLDLAIDLVSQEKLNISTKIYAKLFCKFLPFYENVIRTKILSLFQEIYSNIGDDLWNMIEISEKDKEFLEENLCADDGEEEEEEGEEREDNEEEDENGNKEGVNEEKNQINENDKNNNDNINKKKINKETEKKILDNKNGKLTKEDLELILDNLLIDDPNDKLNTIIIIHENICGKFEQNKEVLIPNIDKIISTFKIVSHKLFYMKDLNSIPIKFAKYLSIVFCKLASNKELISNLSYNVLLDISRELLRYLLINGLDRIGEKQEGNIIFKSINSTMLRILENCDTTYVITALLELIKEFHDKDDKNLVNLAIKCLLKTTHNLSENIDNIKIDKILLQIHLLLLSLQKTNKDMNKKSQIDALIINTVKNIVNDFVQLQKEKILEDYSKSVKNHQINDKYLLKWIKAALEKV